jgi:hypothetical protein
MSNGTRAKLPFKVEGTGTGVASFALTGLIPEGVSRREAQTYGVTYLVRALSIKTTAASLITGLRCCCIDKYVSAADYANVFADIPTTQQVFRVDDGSLGFVAVTPSDTVPIVDSPLNIPRVMEGSGVLFFDVTATGAWELSGYVEVIQE